MKPVVLRMLRIFSMMILKWVVISPYTEHTRNWLLVGWACAKIGYSLAEQMHENWLLASWACAVIGYSLTEHARKLVTHKLIIQENHFGAPLALSEFFLSSSCNPILCTLLSSLSNVSCPLSHFFVHCLPVYVPCLLSLFLVTRPLYPLSRLLTSVPFLSTVPVSPFLWLYFTVTVRCASVSCPLFLHILSSVPSLSYLQECAFFLKIYMHTFDFWLRGGTLQCTCHLFPLSRLCTLYRILCSLSQSWTWCPLSDNF